ncbi:MAG: HNH endonuclease [Actinobacteria bacterium]|nr:HNH endonuclease [Actinomycetota bacterium]
MAKKRKKTKPAVKRQIVEEVGNKCANPGCTNWRVHIHHIEHWAVYESNDKKILIAVCPTCHDSIHHGGLEIPDETLYVWKHIKRTKLPEISNLFVEPGEETKLLTGSIAISTTNQEVIVFQLSQNNSLKFRILDEDIMMLNLKIADTEGKELLRVVDNIVRSKPSTDIEFLQVPGHIKVNVPASEMFIPSDVLKKMQIQEKDYGTSGSVIALDLEVLKPGLVSVQGLWVEDNRAVVITKERLSFIKPELEQPLSMIGDGESSVLKYTGPITTAMFGFEKDQPA